MKTIDVINNDFFEGESIEKDCVVIDELSSHTWVVKLSSDPSIRCLVEFMDGRWEIIDEDYTL